VPDLARRLTAEGLGTALLLAAVVGSGAMGERLAAGNEAIALLANTAATAAAILALIQMCGPVSGAHFNPVVTFAIAWRGDLAWRDAPLYVAVQVLAAICGVALAHLMFGEPVFAASLKARTGLSQALSEFVATFGLVGVIWTVSLARPAAIPGSVAAWIGAAYWFTASTSFANPAVTVARSLTRTFAGIRPVDAPAFVAAELLGAFAAVLVFGWLVSPRKSPTRGSDTRFSR
jgi:glycerol uptake facilitator-like aquaporin